ncbi:MurR/RpiR family transcriptional regulator [Pediococcus claussenii]|uniref:Helix-turn-helix domain, rpiR family protein n=1 Tax=Pediococcus claussenii (strain ATCC BAA-344 / DSM 14800 / JCM 18046 / KCTC 3811 / LMG 21948 / P06) TaxID=701521 RepID=G8PBD1_PEDCP|nr:MurR/RpiR family transcriptional regulator [Pediococcus claussenii]AEV95920.1 helix-turn-helix domain, rpiR family protein [Pediococcus claussenii ATCC BAA-344]ANZ69410.1 RpiR family transcriptional regulator [Pediococcus claussenii]ANZ71230.1 RpiR family transcriptional regulator [Pediococcus claussenii]KRN20525.1 hypothetical protein IV79_GL000582 [Pediococcus claussenii]
MNFFEIVTPNLNTMSKSEMELFNFVVKNMDEVKKMSIREIAAATYVSTATFLRFVKKIGFAGYGEFTTVIKYTILNQNEPTKDVSFTVEQKDYREEYLKNIEETVRVLSNERLHEITAKLSESSNIYLFAKGVSKHAAEYVHYIYSMAGFNVHFPRDKDYRELAAKQVDSKSIVFILTYMGEDEEFLSMINTFNRRRVKPMIVSITEPDNNTIQNLSDTNLYIFTDSIRLNAKNISSRISSIAIMELILYQYVEEYGEKEV